MSENGNEMKEIGVPASAEIGEAEVPPLEQVSPLDNLFRRANVGPLLLLAGAVSAIVLANSAAHDWYHHLWETSIGFAVGDAGLDKPLHLWINDGLMCVYFFVVGLEIKRELLAGELVTRKKALLPAVAALGGMIAPALIYTAVNWGGEGAHGWGVPMATDIAFAAGCLALLKGRVPAGLVVFLVALAIVDDLGAVAVIAIFYTDQIDVAPLMIGASLIILAFCMGQLGVRRTLPYALIGTVIWFAFLRSGVHATVAGVLLAFAIPPDARYKTHHFEVRMRELLRRFVKAEEEWRDYGAHGEHIGKDVQVNARQQRIIRAINDECHHVEAPLQRIEHTLGPVCVLLILPLFAFSNAGLQIDSAGIADALSSRVTWGVMLGLCVGKPLGITLASWIVVRLGVAELPSGVTWTQMIAVGMIAGIGFTMSLFISGLAFTGTDAAQHATEGKLGIMAASVLSAILGLTTVWAATAGGRGRDANAPSAT